MPLFKNIDVDSSTKILIWEITESYEQLFQEVQLNEKSLLRLNGMKSLLHQRGFLSVRKLLQEANYTDFDLFYDNFGKPYLKTNPYNTEPVQVSISHSHHFSTIIISTKKVGIDIEMQREKIIRIAEKFCQSELDFLIQNNPPEPKKDYIKKLTLIWGAKEAIFKIMNLEGISFKNHIRVHEFKSGANKTIASLKLDNLNQDFHVYFQEIESKTSNIESQKFGLVYALEKEMTE